MVVYWRHRKIKYTLPYTLPYTQAYTQFPVYHEHTNDRNWKIFLSYQSYIESFKVVAQGKTH